MYLRTYIFYSFEMYKSWYCESLYNFLKVVLLIYSLSAHYSTHSWTRISFKERIFGACLAGFIYYD